MSEVKEYRQTGYVPPAGATQILLVRHGESRAASADNPFPLVDGHGDPELHPNGRDQAQKVGERLKDQPINAIYVTKLCRTSETAAPLASHLGITPVIDPDLHEVFLGDWEGGILRIKAHDNDPLFVQMREQERWDIIPNGESWDALNERIVRGLDRIHAAHPDELVVAVVHGGVIAHIIAHAAGARPFAFNGADNGSISHIVMVDGKIIVRKFNDSTHLTPDIAGTSGAMT